MKERYSSPTIFNASDMKLSATSRGNNSLVLKKPLEGGFLPTVGLSASLIVGIGRKDIGKKVFGLPK